MLAFSISTFCVNYWHILLETCLNFEHDKITYNNNQLKVFCAAFRELSDFIILRVLSDPGLHAFDFFLIS